MENRAGGVVLLQWGNSQAGMPAVLVGVIWVTRAFLPEISGCVELTHVAGGGRYVCVVYGLLFHFIFIFLFLLI